MPAGGLSVKAGAALTITDGTLTHCGATQKPMFIAAATVAGEEDVICYPVSPDMLFRVKIQEKPTSVKLYDKLTLFVDGEGMATGVTATVTSGVATVVDLEGASNAGDTVTVKFA